MAMLSVEEKGDRLAGVPTSADRLCRTRFVKFGVEY
jgi:hypothetical protein